MSFIFHVCKTIKKLDEWTWFKHCDSSRKGTFQDANEEVNKRWVIFSDYILEWVNQTWSNKMVKSNRHVSEVITASNKAYAIMILKSNLISCITNGKRVKQKW
jgi:hypothetical protein